MAGSSRLGAAGGSARTAGRVVVDNRGSSGLGLGGAGRRDGGGGRGGARRPVTVVMCGQVRWTMLARAVPLRRSEIDGPP